MERQTGRFAKKEDRPLVISSKCGSLFDFLCNVAYLEKNSKDHWNGGLKMNQQYKVDVRDET